MTVAVVGRHLNTDQNHRYPFLMLLDMSVLLTAAEGG
jgi:hypothetical protein